MLFGRIKLKENESVLSNNYIQELEDKAQLLESILAQTLIADLEH